MNTQISSQLYTRAEALMPGGVNSPVRAFAGVGRDPLFVAEAHGDRLIDADGNEYIDYVCSWGPDIFGHGYQPIVEAVKAQCERGLTYGACHEGEIILAEKIRSHFPSMKMLRLVNSGTEAVMSSVRAARGYTGRDKIIKFVGCYHGHSDGLLVKSGSGVLTAGLPDSAGVPKSMTADTLSARFNDLESVERYFERFPEEIAAVLIEPCAANIGVVAPKEGFLNGLRKLCDRYGAILIFDEVITGFRLSAGGAQGFYGVIPDMTALGKIVGGGMPLAAYGGRREIMEQIAPLGPVYQAGTLSGNPIATAAGIAQITAIESTPDLYTVIERKTAVLEKAAKSAGLNVNRCGSLMTVFFTDKTVRDLESAKTSDTVRYARYFRYLLEKGIYTAPSQFEAMFVSYAHSDEDINKTAEIISQFSKE